MEGNNKKTYKRKKRSAVDSTSQLQKEADSSTTGLNQDVDASITPFIWTIESIKMMLQLRFERNNCFEEHRSQRREFWSEISRELRLKGGFIVSGEICDLKYRNMLQTYKKNVVKEERGMQTWIIWEYYNMFKQGLQKNAIAEQTSDEQKMVPMVSSNTTASTEEIPPAETTEEHTAVEESTETTNTSDMEEEHIYLEIEDSPAVKTTTKYSALDGSTEINITSGIEDEHIYLTSLNSNTRTIKNMNSEGVPSLVCQNFNSTQSLLPAQADKQELSATELQECRAFGESIALQLAHIRNDKTRALLQFKFQELLYKAKVGQLTE